MRIGLLGGMFDPVHIGHLRPALEFHARLGLDETRLLPCATPGHRGDAALDAAARVSLLEAAIEGLAGLRVDDRELRLPPPSYTVQTLRDLHAELPGEQFVLAMGEDAFRGFRSWHEWQAILDMADIAVLHRPGETAELDPELAALLAERRCDIEQLGQPGSRGRIGRLDVTPLAVSSTGIRALLARGGDPRFLVPDAVRKLILENDYYRNDKSK